MSTATAPWIPVVRYAVTVTVTVDVPLAVEGHPLPEGVVATNWAAHIDRMVREDLERAIDTAVMRLDRYAPPIAATTTITTVRATVPAPDPDEPF